MVKEYHASIIIPAYNEEIAIGNLLDQFNNMGLINKYEIIIINDGSTDNTKSIVQKYKNVILVNHIQNKGYGAALKTGIRVASMDKVIIMDSDGQHKPDKLEEIAEKLNCYPMVIGERNKSSYKKINRQIGKRLIRVIGEYLVEQKLPDYNSGYRGFQKKIIIKMLNIMPNGFSFSTTSTLAFLKMGYEIGCVNIHAGPRVGRTSSVKFIKDGSKTILLICRIIMLFNPLKIFFPLCMIGGVSSVLLSVYGILFYYRIPNSAVILFVFSMLLFFFGLIADQISMLNINENAERY
ncbi:MAG TPA: glycosyltransferase family 2 protein [Ignavibacteria bacterium]|nr:glycosyltransferase family 2 protein [Ignavibacteria bacterium]